MAGFPRPPAKIIPFRSGPVGPGDLERQFDEHARAFREMIAFLRNVVRDDGKLRNGLVEAEQFNPDLFQAFSDRLVAEADKLLDDVRFVAASAMTAASEARQILDEIKAREATTENNVGRSLAALHVVRERLKAMQELPVAAQVTPALPTGVLGPDAGGFYGVDTGAAPTAQDWAQVAIEWAEHMPDTIPPNTLGISAITGAHWSSRWWANQAAGAFGMMAWWYQGAYPQPGPPNTPNTPTGQPIPTGAMYYDTTLNTMMVWNGSTWINTFSPQAASTATLYYQSGPGQVLFPLTVNDLTGHHFVFDQTDPEGLMVLVNGVRIVPTYDYTLDVPSSTITMLRSIPAGAMVIFDILTQKSKLAPTGSAYTYLMQQITPDGSTTGFPLVVAVSGQPPNLAKNEELLVSVDGVQQAPGGDYSVAFGGTGINFAEAPAADSKIFIVWFGPETL